MNWTKPDEFITWPVRLNEPTTYEVFINYLAPENSAGGKFTVSLGSQNLSGEVKPGDESNRFAWPRFVAAGQFRNQSAAAEINGAELFRLRSLELKPVP